MNKLRLKEKVDLAFFKEYGEAGGWNLFLELKREKLSQRERARRFGVAPETMWRWDQQHKQEVANG